jgi:hypothetical protein
MECAADGALAIVGIIRFGPEEIYAGMVVGPTEGRTRFEKGTRARARVPFILYFLLIML